MTYYRDTLAAWGEHADSALLVKQVELDAALEAEAALAQQLADTVVDRDALAYDNAALDAEVLRLRRVIRRLRNPVDPPMREPIFSAKPEPSSETEYARSEARAGVAYPLHRHYATSHDQMVALANQCQGDICAITYFAYDAANKRLLVLPEKLAQLADTKTIWLGYKHEPEDDIEEGLFSLAEFRSAQQRLHDALEVINVGRTYPIVLDLCLQGPWTWRTRNPDDYFIPGVHTQVGTDPYPGFINPAYPYTVTGEQMFGRQVAWAAERGIELWVPEYGITAHPTDPAARSVWIRQMNTYAREHEILALSYWDHQANALTFDDEFAAAGGA